MRVAVITLGIPVEDDDLEVQLYEARKLAEGLADSAEAHILEVRVQDVSEGDPRYTISEVSGDSGSA